MLISPVPSLGMKVNLDFLGAGQARAPLRGAGGTALRAGGALVGRGIWPKMGKAMPFSLMKMHKFRH